MSEGASAVQQVKTATGRYVIDGRSSRFTVRAFVTGLGCDGPQPDHRIRDLNGEMRFNLTRSKRAPSGSPSRRLRWACRMT